MSEPKRQGKQARKKVNYWKWALLSLLGVLVMGVFFLVRLTRPVTSTQDQTEQPTPDRTEAIEIVSELSKADVEFVLNSFLEAELEAAPTPYQIRIEEDMVLSSAVDIMGLTIPFSLTFEPYATEDGNLQLRAQKVEVASLSLPVSVIMAALGNQMDLPSFIQLDSETQMILVNLNELHHYYPYGVALEKVDLINDEIRLKLFVNKATLKQALDSGMKQTSVSE